MTAKTHRVRFKGDPRAFTILGERYPGLRIEEDQGEYWISGGPLEFESEADWHKTVAAFAGEANMLIGLLDIHSGPITSSGVVEVADGDRCDFVLLTEMLRNESAVFPPSIVLAARGGGPVPRPIYDRALELSGREPRFQRASEILTGCGEDLVDLYMVAELILRAHRRIGERTEHAQARLLSELPVRTADWQAMMRTVRPSRHAEPHDMNGPTLTAVQIRTLLQHTLKLWLANEVPV